MKFRSLEEIKKDLERIMTVSHPGNMQLQISDRCILHCADCITDYDDENNDVVTGLDCSFSFYGEHIQATIQKDDEGYFGVGLAEGNLLSSFDDFIEDEDNADILKTIWSAVEKWQLN